MTRTANPQPTTSLTVVLNVHREAKLLQPTLLSLRRAIDAARDHGIAPDLLVVLDRPDDATREYLDRRMGPIFEGVPHESVEVDNGDLGMSRNSGIERASGRYVALCDADNVPSTMWLAHAVAALEESPSEAVAHPEWVISFDARDTIWRIRSSTDPALDARALAQFNFWDSTCVAARSTFEKVPYAETTPGGGFGPEDWHWNLETLTAGIDHLAVPETALFYRVKRSGSLWAQHQASSALLPRSDYLSSPQTALRINAHNASHQPEGASSSSTVAVAKRRAFTLARGAAARVYRVGRKVIGRGRRGNVLLRGIRQTLVDVYYEPTSVPKAWGVLPTWLMQEWRDAQEFEPGVFPSRELLQRIGYAEPIVTRFVDAYWQLLEALGEPIDYLFLVPWLKTGGADKVILHYVKALNELAPDARVVVLGTEPGDSNWAGLLSSNAQFVAVPPIFHRLNSGEQEQLLGTLIVQLAPKVLHIVNSHTGYRMLARYRTALMSLTKTFVSIFCLDRSTEGKKVHYILDDFRAYGDHVDGILSDNADIARWFVDTYDADPDRFHVHYQPFDGFSAERTTVPRALPVAGTQTLEVGWAGRFDRQKRLDTLLAVAGRSAELGLDVRFHVFGAPVIDSAPTPSVLPGNVVMHGPFDGGLGSLPADVFSVFLLTSEWEGLPNTLLEAGSLGFAVVAPDVGGVRELIQDETGYLVASSDDIDAYVERLREIVADPDEATRRTAHLRQLIEERHTWSEFTNSVAGTPGYIEPSVS